jgi:hypothetical protein
MAVSTKMAVFWVVAQTTQRYNPEDSHLQGILSLSLSLKDRKDMPSVLMFSRTHAQLPLRLTSIRTLVCGYVKGSGSCEVSNNSWNEECSQPHHE